MCHFKDFDLGVCLTLQLWHECFCNHCKVISSVAFCVVCVRLCMLFKMFFETSIALANSFDATNCIGQ